MRLLIFLQVILISFFCIFTISAKAQSTEVLFKVNGVEIPQSHLEVMVKRKIQAGEQDNPKMRKGLIEE